MELESNVSMEEMIVKAAEDLFLEKGFAMTSTTDIAKAVGCNQALVHYYFRTKERLFMAIFENKIRMFGAALFAIDNEGGSFEERLKRKIEAHFEMLRANPRLPFLVISEIMRDPSRIDDLRGNFSEIMQTVAMGFQRELDRAIEEGVIREISFVDLLLNIVSMNIAVFVTAPMVKGALGVSDEMFDMMLDNRKREIVTMILNGLRPIK